ncbi:MAG: type II toxin-antitoxin system RelE/ParE family toxin [Leadbetterella sp.]|nr:type II toxin-antitoxin system RelE/ParE family toxin [Leadbetterella sp.]
MKNGYKIKWTPHALTELQSTIEYLEQNFTQKEIIRLVQKIESITKLIARYPNLFPKSNKANMHRAVILKYNNLYYRVKNEHIEILSFFSNRQSPAKKKLAP